MCLCLKLSLEDFIPALQLQDMAISRSFWLVVFSVFSTELQQLSLQITPPCSSEQHYEYSGRCCTKCEPGKYMSAKCTRTSETLCQPCGPNEYMDIWNEEEKCSLHKICDQGRALIEVDPGNSTNQRRCACIAGYHWNEDCDCCRRNKKCPPGFGVRHPIQQNKDTVCMLCPRGSFSNVSSATDACKTWTNCTALGTEEKIPGNTLADVVCKEQLKMQPQDETNTLFYILITPLLIAVVGIVIFAILYRNKGKALTANLQYWANDMCKQMKGTKDSPHGTFVNRSVASPAGLRLLGGTYLLDLDEYSFSEDACYPHGDILNRKTSPDAIHCELEDDFPTLPPAAVSEDDQFRQIPTEDEYMGRPTQGPCYFPLLSRPESKPVSPFSEPLEVGENDSLSQCFTGTESLIDSANCCCSDPSYGVDPVHASSHLQNSFHQSTCSSMGEADNQAIGVSLSVPKEIRCAACCVSCRESSSKAGNAMHSLKESGPSPLCTCCLDSPSVDQGGLASNNGVRSDPSDRYDRNGTKDHNAKGAPESSNSSTSDPPAASANVTGNGNSTFISSGQVMNFKGEIIVVYVSQNSQEGSMSPGSSDDSLGTPVQEENLVRCETFAGNTRQYKEKCAEMNSYHSVGDEPPSIVGEYKRTAGPIAQEEVDESQNMKLFYNEASRPVQEEGKPGQFLKQPLH